MTIPIGADRYQDPLWPKLAITLGHATAIFVMLYPLPDRPLAIRILAMLVSLYAGLQVMVLGAGTDITAYRRV